MNHSDAAGIGITGLDFHRQWQVSSSVVDGMAEALFVAAENPAASIGHPEADFVITGTGRHGREHHLLMIAGDCEEPGLVDELQTRQ